MAENGNGENVVPPVDTDHKPKMKEKLGLTTTEALDILQRDINRVLLKYEDDYKINK